MNANQDMVAYYAQRAHQYERIYHKPERQADLHKLAQQIPQMLAGKRVLEIACGTGYWTERIATTAHSINATDVNEEVLELAAHKSYARQNVQFNSIDAYTLTGIKPIYDAVFAGFWWSHVPKSRLSAFLSRVQQVLKAGALVIILDNRYVTGSSTVISDQDNDGNTYQLRNLDDGTQHRVLKNFPNEAELRTVLQDHADQIDYLELDYYWLLSCHLRLQQ